MYGLPDSIRVVQLILVQYVLVRIQVGQLRKRKVNVTFLFLFSSETTATIEFSKFLKMTILAIIYSKRNFKISLGNLIQLTGYY